MKRSEFDAIARMEVAGEGYSTPSIVKILIDAHRKGAEAAGVVWDPEEEPLSPRLRYAAPLILPVWHVWRDQSQKEAHVAEAVRRYNAWSALWQLADDYDNATAVRLRVILRGEK